MGPEEFEAEVEAAIKEHNNETRFPGLKVARAEWDAAAGVKGSLAFLLINLPPPSPEPPLGPTLLVSFSEAGLTVIGTSDKSSDSEPDSKPPSTPLTSDPSVFADLNSLLLNTSSGFQNLFHSALSSSLFAALGASAGD